MAIDVEQYEDWGEARADIAEDLSMLASFFGADALERAFVLIEEAEVADAAF